MHYEQNTLEKYDKNMQKQDTLNQMGDVTKCYKMFFHKNLSIFSLFCDHLIFHHPKI
jgi:hypothetical protein